MRGRLPGSTSLTIAGGINELLYSEILHGAGGLPADPAAGTRLPRRAALSRSDRAAEERDLARAA